MVAVADEPVELVDVPEQQDDQRARAQGAEQSERPAPGHQGLHVVDEASVLLVDRPAGTVGPPVGRGTATGHRVLLGFDGPVCRRHLPGRCAAPVRALWAAASFPGCRSGRTGAILGRCPGRAEHGSRPSCATSRNTVCCSAARCCPSSATGSPAWCCRSRCCRSAAGSARSPSSPRRSSCRSRCWRCRPGSGRTGSTASGSSSPRTWSGSSPSSAPACSWSPGTPRCRISSCWPGRTAPPTRSSRRPSPACCPRRSARCTCSPRTPCAA